MTLISNLQQTDIEQQRERASIYIETRSLFYTWQ